jgi:hypothetical protein
MTVDKLIEAAHEANLSDHVELYQRTHGSCCNLGMCGELRQKVARPTLLGTDNEPRSNHEGIKK